MLPVFAFANVKKPGNSTLEKKPWYLVCEAYVAGYLRNSMHEKIRLLRKNFDVILVQRH